MAFKKNKKFPVVFLIFLFFLIKCFSSSICQLIKKIQQFTWGATNQLSTQFQLKSYSLSQVPLK